jgi:hypothetical protein
MSIQRVRPDSSGHLAPSVFFFQMAAAAYMTAWAPAPAGAVVSTLEPTVEIIHTGRQHGPALSVLEIVTNLKNAGLPISAIAEAARVERKTVYAWLEGTTVRDANTARMTDIYRALFPAGDRDLRDLYRMWSTPLPDGSSLKSLLAAEKLDAKAVAAAAVALTSKARALGERKRRMAIPGEANGFADGLEVGFSG